MKALDLLPTFEDVKRFYFTRIAALYNADIDTLAESTRALWAGAASSYANDYLKLWHQLVTAHADPCDPALVDAIKQFRKDMGLEA